MKTEVYCVYILSKISSNLSNVWTTKNQFTNYNDPLTKSSTLFYLLIYLQIYSFLGLVVNLVISDDTKVKRDREERLKGTYFHREF